MVFRQLSEALLQRISQKVKLLIGLIETSLGLKGKERKRIRQRIKTDWKEIILLQQSRDPFHLKSKIAWSQKWQILTCCPVLHSLPLNVPSFLWLFQSPEVSWHSWLPRLPQPLSWHGDTAPPPADLKGWWWAFLEYKVTLKSFTLMTSDL